MTVKVIAGSQLIRCPARSARRPRSASVSDPRCFQRSRIDHPRNRRLPCSSGSEREGGMATIPLAPRRLARALQLMRARAHSSQATISAASGTPMTTTMERYPNRLEHPRTTSEHTTQPNGTPYAHHSSGSSPSPARRSRAAPRQPIGARIKTDTTRSMIDMIRLTQSFRAGNAATGVGRPARQSTRRPYRTLTRSARATSVNCILARRFVVSEIWRVG